MKIFGAFREVFKNAKRRKPAQIFCPRCASPKIHLSSGLDLWLTPKSYVCDDCGYNGLIVMELEESPVSIDEETIEREE
ncbi:MAG: hypothetical protein FWC33_02410 [Candidatus Bathyarchaeota archaeon]|nr:hypothetical protein [Candidatus Termiticorpusculum sp.]